MLVRNIKDSWQQRWLVAPEVPEIATVGTLNAHPGVLPPAARPV